MITIHDSLAGKSLSFHYCESINDAVRAYKWASKRSILALDTEASAINCYLPGWQLRTFQFSDDRRAFVIPAEIRNWIEEILFIPGMFWLGHNGSHDIRSLDQFLGYETGIKCRGETYIPAHYADSRKRDEGGIGHGLKEQAIAHIDPQAGKWDAARRAAFMELRIAVPGEFYKSSNKARGVKKGDPKFRKARLSEGWALIDPKHPAMIAYAASDPILTYFLWQYRKEETLKSKDLYLFDRKIQEIGDRLQRKGMRVDVSYTTRFREALDKKATRLKEQAAALGCENIYSGDQIARALLTQGAALTEKTPSGKYKTDDAVLRSVIEASDSESNAARLCRYILGAKRVSKRREAYADAMLRGMDKHGRVHPSINTLAARTTRMSVSEPALQQLPTKEAETDG